MIAIAVLGWLINSWLVATIIVTPIQGMLFSRRKNCHKEFPILLLIIIFSLTSASLLLYSDGLLEQILFSTFRQLNLLIDKINQTFINFDQPPPIPYQFPSSVEKPIMWFGIFWLYLMLLLKPILKLITALLPTELKLFFYELAYFQHSENWRIRPHWVFQRNTLLILVVVCILLFVGIWWNTFYHPTLENQITKDWLLMVPTMLIPIFISWHLWLKGLLPEYHQINFSATAGNDSKILITFSYLWKQYREKFSEVWRKAGNIMPGNDSVQIQQQMEKRLNKGLILHSYPNRQVLQFLQKQVCKTLERGKKVYVIYDDFGSSHTQNQQREWDFLFQLSSVSRQAAEESIVSLSSFIKDKLAYKNTTDSLNHLELIIIPQGEQMFERPYTWKLMAQIIRDHESIKNDELKSIVISEPRKSLETAVRNILTFYPSQQQQNPWIEYRPPLTAKNQFWWTIWEHKDKNYIDNIENINRDNPLGAAVILSQFVGRLLKTGKDIKNILLSGSNATPNEDAETLQKATNAEQCWFDINQQSAWKLMSDLHNQPAIITAELKTGGNPWRTLTNISQAANNAMLCNVLIKKHMLSDFLIENETIFALNPDLMSSPNFNYDSPKDAALQTLLRIEAAGKLSIDKIEEALLNTRKDHTTTQNNHNLFEQLYNSTTNLLGQNFADRLRLTAEQVWHNGKFTGKAFVKLSGGNLPNAGLDWLREFKIHAEDGSILKKIRKDHLQQRYWQGKIVAIDGKKYKVDNIDDANSAVNVSHAEPPPLADYRCQKILNITAQKPQPDEQIKTTDNNSNQFSITTFIADYSITTTKIVQSDSHWNESTTDIIDLGTEPLQRAYHAKRVLKISHHNADGNSSLSAAAATALSAWLNEAITTTMPETAAFFIAVAEIPAESLPQTPIAATIIPRFNETNEDPQNCIWIIEDSNTDMGIIQAIKQDYWYLLGICHQWIKWHETPNTKSSNAIYSNQYDHRNWFAYGQPEIDPAINFTDLKAFLEIHKDRFTENQPATNIKFLDPETAAIETCDFCGKKLPEKDQKQRLKDGRVSCPQCAEDAKQLNIETLENLYNELIKPFFIKQFNVSNFEKVTVELTDQKNISEIQGSIFVPTPEFDARATGLATIQGDLKVLLETGFSIEETLTTLVHELCHTWQAMNLDVDRITEETGLLLVEGHAVYVESFFIYKQCQNPYQKLRKKQFKKLWSQITKRHQADDVYGQGYRLLLQKINNQSPFDWLRQTYGK